ncbi:hypothetical protein [Leekyejoonella antrihumi]|uniref:DUF559 domain-containing protein n=1 Tax=Leekyejoonella antrihumi TaxID=1660198 RepID=A0A563E9T6_9MICO|nr:hypothetical protein [Leekyejoonella antrihumi]TWP38971.1 hypothetical protein FGL98_00820 [Leekyejoonella antrihumi]
MADHLRLRAPMAERGGAATASELEAAAGRRGLAAAVRDGVIVRVAHRYVTPSLVEHLQAAFALGGVVSHQSAVARYGWSAKHQPKKPSLTVRAGRHLSWIQQRGVAVSWRDLDPAEVIDGVTGPQRTVVDCALSLHLDEALAIADSALRCGDIDPGELRRATVSGRNCRSARRVLQLADSRAANPLESVLRAIAVDVVALHLEPQGGFRGDEWFARVDLADQGLGLVLKAEGFEHHGTRKGFDRDCERYVNLLCAGVIVLRFTWTQVMYRPDWVRERIREMVQQRTNREDSMSARSVSSPGYRRT